MDDSQIILAEMLKEVPDCISSRQKLKAVLMDSLPSKKLEINQILNAYDEGVIGRLKESPDATLCAIKLIKKLSDEYGLTAESSKWAVVSWCYILGYVEIADALDTLSIGGIPTQSKHVVEKLISSVLVPTKQVLTLRQVILD